MAPVTVVLVHFGGLGLELGGHDSQSLCAGEVEATSRDSETVFGLVTQILGSQHQSVVSSSGCGRVSA
jgi:hypothetical protein